MNRSVIKIYKMETQRRKTDVVQIMQVLQVTSSLHFNNMQFRLKMSYKEPNKPEPNSVTL